MNCSKIQILAGLSTAAAAAEQFAGLTPDHMEASGSSRQAQKANTSDITGEKKGRAAPQNPTM